MRAQRSTPAGRKPNGGAYGGWAKTKEQNRASHLSIRYGMTSEQYERLFAAQGGTCAICGHRPRTQALHVDHDHETLRVRGLLCSYCNRIRATDAVAAYFAAPPAFGVVDHWVPEGLEIKYRRRKTRAAETATRRRRTKRKTLTQEQERTIRILLHFQRRSVRSLANTFGISEARIRAIRDAEPLGDESTNDTSEE